jgi:hypothetical protein
MDDVLTKGQSAARATSASVPRTLLVAGLLAGALAAAAGLLVPDDASHLPAQAVAMVGHRPILRDQWLRAVAAVASERNVPLTAADQRHILDRLIDEELLVQHGIALGLPEQDPRLRSEMVQEVMRSASATTTQPADDELRAFYAANQDFFAQVARLRVAAWRVDAGGARREFSPPLPDVLLPPSKLQTYLGPSLTAAAMGLREGESSAPVDGVIVQVRQRQADAPPAFEQVRDEVSREARRRADEAAVRALLVSLRKQGHVVVEPDLP